MIRRPPKYHHYWPRLAQMPGLKHTRAGKSEVLDWICREFGIGNELANHVFSSARSAKYLVSRQGLWYGDAMCGFRHWTRKPAAEPADEEFGRHVPLEEAKENFRRLKEKLGMEQGHQNG